MTYEIVMDHIVVCCNFIYLFICVGRNLVEAIMRMMHHVYFMLQETLLNI